MKQKTLLRSLLLLCALILGMGSAWADSVTQIATATFDGKNGNYTDGWTTTGTGVGRTDCVVIGYGENITSPAFDLSEYSSISITFTGRRYGSLSGSKATVDASIGGSSVGTIDITQSSVGAVNGSITFTPTSSMTGAVLVFTCTNATSAGSTHGAGIGSITITGTKTTTAVLTGITLSGDYETTFSQNGTFSYEGLVVTASYDDETSSEVTGYSVSAPDMTTLGTQTVTVSYTENDVTKTATYDITIEEAQDYATLPFSWAGGSSADLRNVNGVTVNCNSSDYSSSNTPYLVKFSSDGHYVMVKTDSQPGKVTVGVKMLGGSDATSITVQGSADGITFTDVETLNISGNKNDVLNLETTNVFAATDRYVRLYFNKGSGSNVGVGPITIAVPTTDPAIVASNVELEADATSGEIAYSIVNPVAGTSLTAASEADWISDITVAEDKVTFTTSANEGAERTATITLTYGTLTKEVTVTQAAAPVIYTTIPDLFAAATSTASDVNVTFNNWVVSGVKGSNAYVTDNSGNGFIIYTSNHGFEVNDKLSGTVSGTPLKLYKGAAEFTDLTASTNGLTVSKDGSITVITDKAIADLGGVNTGAVIQLSNLTFDGTNLSDGTNTIKPYTTLYNGSFDSGKIYNVTGVYVQYDTTKEILPRSAADIEEVASTEPSITLSTNKIEATAEQTNGTINVTCENFEGTPSVQYEFRDAAGNVDYVDWITIEIEDNIISYYIGENKGDARTAYILVYATDDQYNVASETVTVTQAAYVAPEVPVDPAVAGVGAFVKVTSTEDITAGNYLIVYEGNDTHDAVAFNGALTTLDVVNNGIKVAIVGDKIPATSATVAATFTIQPSGSLKSASGQYIGKAAYSNGLDSEKDEALANTFAITEGSAVITAEGGCILRYNYASDQLRFRYYKNGQQAIQLYKYDATAPAFDVITLNAACTDGEMVYGTFSSSSAFVVSDDIVVSEVGITDGKLNVQEYETGVIVPANTGVMVSALEAGNYAVTLSADAGTSVLGDDNCLRPSGDAGITANEMAAADANSLFYRLTMHNGETLGFWWGAAEGAAFALAANKAYLTVPVNAARPGFVLGGETTAISGMKSEVNENAPVYNMQGQRVAQPAKGLYIVNGKKYINK